MSRGQSFLLFQYLEHKVFLCGDIIDFPSLSVYISVYIPCKGMYWETRYASVYALQTCSGGFHELLLQSVPRSAASAALMQLFQSPAKGFVVRA